VDAKAEQKFRQGYTHGVTRVIGAVSGVLSEEQVLALKKWSTNDLLAWRFRAGDEFEEAPPPPVVTPPRAVKS
jgi:hypothetical protein